MKSKKRLNQEVSLKGQLQINLDLSKQNTDSNNRSEGRIIKISALQDTKFKNHVHRSIEHLLKF